MTRKPLGRKAYGSIPHIPGSRRGPSDHGITVEQANILTLKPRDRRDTIVVQQKLDGSNVAVARLEDDRIVSLVRSGYLAETSNYQQHHLFAAWVKQNHDRFYQLLSPGEWVSGEWLAQSHGTRYTLNAEPFAVFDLWSNGDRILYQDLLSRVNRQGFQVPALLSYGNTAIGVTEAMALMEEVETPYPTPDEQEGFVWRLEKDGSVEFLAKWVSPRKKDGLYLPGCWDNPDNMEPVWNEGVKQWLPKSCLRN